jgi:hypothetical protein
MHINPKFYKVLEELCLKQQGYHYHHHHYNSRFDRDYGSFVYLEDLDDTNKYEAFKKYNLSDIRNDNDFKMCLGLEFLDMDLSMLSMTNKKLEMSHYMDFDNESRQFMPSLMKRNKDLSKEDIIKTFEYKLMNFESSIQMSYHAIRELFMIRNVLNCTPLVDEWLSFAKTHNVTISSEMAPVLEFLEKDKESFKIYQQLMSEFSDIRNHSIGFIKKSHSIMREIYYNKPHHGFEGFINPRNSFNSMNREKYVVDNEIINEVDRLQEKIDFLKNNIKKAMVSVKKDEYDEVEIRNNNKVLITSIHSAYKKMKDKIVLPVTKAKFFSEDVTLLTPNKIYDEHAIETFLEKRTKDVMLIAENISHQNIHYKKVIIFEDKSLAILVDGQERFEVFVDINETKHLVKAAMVGYLKHTLRKNPTIAKVISNVFESAINKINESAEPYYDKPLQFNKIMVSIDTYFKNENILKSLKFDFIEACKKVASFEKIDDKMHKLIREHKIKKYAESIVSSKYKHLYNTQSYKLFKELYDLGIDSKIVQEMIGKKLAAVETEKMFNEHIKSLINSFNDFDMESIKIKASSNKVNVISDTDNILILEISNFEQSKKLGSGSWCISRNKTYFDQYVERGGKQYFIYDFNQTSKSVKSLVGITLTSTKTVKAAHSKSDGHFSDKKMIDYLIEKVTKLEEQVKPKVTAVRKARKKKETDGVDITNLTIGF